MDSDAVALDIFRVKWCKNPEWEARKVKFQFRCCKCKQETLTLRCKGKARELIKDIPTSKQIGKLIKI